MTSRDIIRRVLARENPPRIGLTFSPFDGKPRICDTVGAGAEAAADFAQGRWTDEQGGECWTDEWGCVWRRIPGKTKGGEVIRAPIKTWDDLSRYAPPTLTDPRRYEAAAQTFEQHTDRYRLGSIAGCCFNVARYLRRMDQYLLDCAAEPERVSALNQMVSDIVVGQLDIYADIGADAVFFCEDWGTQDRLLISPRMWRELFRPGFERLVSRAHSKGIAVWMHSCGCVRDIVPDLVELGIDVLQFDQADLHGIDELAAFHEQVTFWCPVDIQTTLQTGHRGTIQAKAREMVEKLGRGGGFIAKDYPDEFSISADPMWQQWAYEAFVETGTFKTT